VNDDPMSDYPQGRTHESADERCSDGSYIDDGKRVTSWLPPQRKHGRRPSSAGAARFIELTRLLRRRSCSR
jgi:hypothetical protein